MTAFIGCVNKGNRLQAARVKNRIVLRCQCIIEKGKNEKDDITFFAPHVPAQISDKLLKNKLQATKSLELYWGLQRLFFIPPNAAEHIGRACAKIRVGRHRV